MKKAKPAAAAPSDRDPSNRGTSTDVVDLGLVAGLRFFASFFALGDWSAGARTAVTVLFPLRFCVGLYRFFAHQFRMIDQETVREPDDKQAPGTFSPAVLLFLSIAAISLTLQEYLGGRDAFARWFPELMRSPRGELWSYAWWSGWRVFGYVVLPLGCVLLMRGERLRDYHFSTKGFFKHLWIYLLMFALIFPAVYIASRTQSFRHTYPFYRWANRSSFDLWTWEAFYVTQFLALEIFFRGFLLQGLRKALGSNAIFIMIVPYCMIHYGKPMSETIGAIGAGILLGTIAMRTRSIWGGVLIHVGVAISMDIFALAGCPPAESGRPCRF